MSVEVQWTETDPQTGERRFLCAKRFARKWTFHARSKRREDWSKIKTPTRDMWETLLDSLERRYQRREGVDEDDLKVIRKLLQDWSNEPEFDGG